VAVRTESVSLEHEIESVLAGFTDTGSSSITVDTRPGRVIADSIRVRQILRNLISNALRYGGHRIEIVTSAEPGALAVEVIDDGTGIDVDDHERIFVAYERAHHTEGQPGSVGLGLTVSRTLAELMGGSLTYRFDERSIFRLELPSAVDNSTDDRTLDGVLGTEIGANTRTVGAGRYGVDVG
jgi:signal transduction histidine kinase